MKDNYLDIARLVVEATRHIRKCERQARLKKILEQNASKHQDEGESFHVGQIHVAENRTTLPHPVCSSNSFDYAVPSTSRTVIGASACGESTVRVPAANGYAERNATKHQDGGEAAAPLIMPYPAQAVRS
ncbi:hypothetical protein MRX96_014986 [Rhipicephalus microplus]